MAAKSARQVALLKFRSEDWEQWRASVDDPEWFDAGYERRREETEAMADRLRSARLEVVWIAVEPDAMAEWCRKRGCPNIHERRMQFAAEKIGNVRIH